MKRFVLVHSISVFLKITYYFITVAMRKAIRPTEKNRTTQVLHQNLHRNYQNLHEDIVKNANVILHKTSLVLDENPRN